jgi:Putative zinc-finger
MNHDEAVRLMVAEKYLLDELSPELREQFEEHYFECQECALDVRTGTAFVEHSKVALSDSQHPHPVAAPPQPSAIWAWLRPALVGALAVLLAIVGYQNFVTYPKLKQTVALATTPQILPSASLINVNTRGANRPVVEARQGQPFLLFVDIPGEARFTSYVAELQGPGGNSEWSLNIPADATKETLSIRVPSDDYSSGMHTLVVRGVGPDASSSEVGRYPFELQFQK